MAHLSNRPLRSEEMAAALVRAGAVVGVLLLLAGALVAGCPSGTHMECDGGWIDITTDVEHCGGCGHRCPEGAACAGGRCECASGLVPCEMVAFSRCADLAGDLGNCGACGVVCAEGASCNAGVCACPPGEDVCPPDPWNPTEQPFGVCADLQADDEHCGACYHECPTSTDSICAGGACICRDSEAALCDEDTDPVCARLDEDPRRCGACDHACLPGESCASGACVCPEPRTDCGDACSDLSSDTWNCGACRQRCAWGAACTSGTCLCPAGRAACPEGDHERCAFLSNDPSHCGACGHACGPEEECSAGVCVCPADHVVCRDGCVDPRVDRAHCGTCDRSCDADATCGAGECVHAVELALGAEHSCARLENGAVACWGGDEWQQLGTEETVAAGIGRPRIVPGLTDAVGLAAGFHHTCAVHADRGASCWGRNQHAQLGAEFPARSRGTPERIAGLAGVRVLGAGSRTCAVLDGGGVSCWGDWGNADRLEGISPRPIGPTPVEGLDGVLDVDAGMYGSCAVRDDGTVWCWGANFYGELGDGTLTARDRPGPVSALGGATGVASNAYAWQEYSDERMAQPTGCAVRADGQVSCWGYARGVVNPAGGPPDPWLVPVTVPGLDDAVRVEVGGSHICALRRDGTLGCWGDNGVGEFGDGHVTVRSLSPIPVVGLDSVVDFDLGNQHSCAIRADHSVWCWGMNDVQQLGDGTTDIRSLPVRVVW